MGPFPLGKDLQNPITSSFQTIIQLLRASAASMWNKPVRCSVSWENSLHFPPLFVTRVSWTIKKGISWWTLFVLFSSTFSKLASVTFDTPPVLSTSARVTYWIDIWDTALQLESGIYRCNKHSRAPLSQSTAITQIWLKKYWRTKTHGRFTQCVSRSRTHAHSWFVATHNAYHVGLLCKEIYAISA